LRGPRGGADGGYLQPGSVQGEILIGEARIPFGGTGLRARRWGRADWWGGAVRSWAGLVDPGGSLVVLDEVAARGPGGVPPRARGSGGVPPRAGDVEVLGTAPVLVTGAAGRKARLERALCRSGDRLGWAEWLLAANGGRTGK
jgi:hypothetical protein